MRGGVAATRGAAHSISTASAGRHGAHAARAPNRASRGHAAVRELGLPRRSLARERPPCEDPICVPVPGVEHPDARLWTAVGNFGLLIAASRHVAGRADVRVHVPVSNKGDAADSGRTRAELSVGIAARL